MGTGAPTFLFDGLATTSLSRLDRLCSLLQQVHLVVQSTLGQQFLVSASLNNFSMVQYKDEICVLDG
jgi:hypothetical protein